ncbi:hypothetical protein AB0J21_27310 [Streptomyces sp. NPDC049954]
MGRTRSGHRAHRGRRPAPDRGRVHRPGVVPDAEIEAVVDEVLLPLLAP